MGRDLIWKNVYLLEDLGARILLANLWLTRLVDQSLLRKALKTWKLNRQMPDAKRVLFGN
jgi:hypothetical protein